MARAPRLAFKAHWPDIETGGWRWTSHSPTGSGPEGSSPNELRFGSLVSLPPRSPPHSDAEFSDTQYWSADAGVRMLMSRVAGEPDGAMSSAEASKDSAAPGPQGAYRVLARKYR